MFLLNSRSPLVTATSFFRAGTPSPEVTDNFAEFLRVLIRHTLGSSQGHLCQFSGGHSYGFSRDLGIICLGSLLPNLLIMTILRSVMEASTPDLSAQTPAVTIIV